MTMLHKMKSECLWKVTQDPLSDQIEKKSLVPIVPLMIPPLSAEASLKSKVGRSTATSPVILDFGEEISDFVSICRWSFAYLSDHFPDEEQVIVCMFGLFVWHEKRHNSCLVQNSCVDCQKAGYFASHPSFWKAEASSTCSSEPLGGVLK